MFFININSEFFMSDALDTGDAGKRFEKKRNKNITIPSSDLNSRTLAAESRLIGEELLKSLYILYEKKPFCILATDIFAMFPIEKPTIGYKLSFVDLDKKNVLAHPKFITESQALDILFIGTSTVRKVTDTEKVSKK